MDGKAFRWLIGFLGLCLCSVFSRVYAQSQADWQQKVDTKLDVVLDDTNHLLHGVVKLNYHNNSPDTLSYLYLHLYPNAYKNDRTAFEQQAVANKSLAHYYSSESDRGYIDSLDFVVDGRSAALRSTDAIDIVQLLLPQALLPGQSVEISSPFRVKIPKVFSRLGHKGQSYQITQWFPKPAVYDAKGWHPMPYLDQGEFYSEFGDYDVRITLPENYLLLATGDWVGADKERQWMDSLAQIPLEQLPVSSQDPPSSPHYKTIRFKANRVHDFAWFADKNWLLRKDTLHLASNSEPVTVYRAYLPESRKNWMSSQQAVATAMRGYSQMVGPYPYKTVKLVEGPLMPSAGGMEYPTIANIAPSRGEEGTNTAIIHEVGHNWFYGILGSNERDYPWMDEGINSFYEKKLFTASNFRMGGKNALFWVYAALGSTKDLFPADTVSTYYPSINYGVDIYYKVPLYLTWLEDYMGSDTFKLAMQTYFQRFQYKHPQPEDFRKTFQEQTSKDISWFFNLLHEAEAPNFKIKSVKTSGKETRVLLKNRTECLGPVRIDFVGLQDEDTIKASLWSVPFAEEGTVTYKAQSSKPIRWQSIRIADVVPDFNTSDNGFKQPLAIRPIAGFNSDFRRKLWLTPTLGYNDYDGFMMGIGLHNLSVPQNKFQFALSPLYGSNSGRIVGLGFISFSHYPSSGAVKDWELKLSAKSFNYQESDLNVGKSQFAGYQKLSPEWRVNFRPHFPRSTIERSLYLKGYWIKEEHLSFQMHPTDSLYRPSGTTIQNLYYGKLGYHFEDKRTFNPYGYTLEGEVGSDFAKLSVTGQLRIDYHLVHKSLRARAYVGKLLSFHNDGGLDDRYWLTGTYSGLNDYLMDGTYFGRLRNTGLWSQQIAIKEGGFKMNTLQYANRVGISDQWLGAINLNSDLPLNHVPLCLFADLLAMPNNSGQISVLYEAGVALRLGEVFGLYLPLVMSKEYSDYSKSVLGKNRILKSVSFSLDLNKIPWTRLTRLLNELQ